MRQWAAIGLVLAAPAAMAQERSGTVQYLTEYDEGKTTSVPAGAELRVRLRQQGGTAYQWDLRRNDRIEQLRAPTIVNGGIIGGASQREFRLRVVGAGRFPLTFGLREPGQPPVKEMTFDIAVRSARPDPYPAPDWNDGPDTVEPLTRADAGRSIDIPVGETQTIALDANATTGYSWRLVRADNVTLSGPIRYQASPKPRGIVGRGGTALIDFRVNRRGIARLVLEYSGGPGRPGQSLTYFFDGI